MTRALPALLAVTLLGAALAACGGMGSASRTSASAAPKGEAASTASGAFSPRATAKLDADGDNDNRSGSRYDGDDDRFVYFGHAADGADARAIAALVKHYYAAGAAGDGARACPLLYSVIAESVVEEYRSSELRGSTCAAVMSRVFQRYHGELVGKLAALGVVKARVEGDRGVAMMSFGAGREGHLLLHRERGDWKVGMLLDARLP